MKCQLNGQSLSFQLTRHFLVMGIQSLNKQINQTQPYSLKSPLLGSHRCLTESRCWQHENPYFKILRLFSHGPRVLWQIGDKSSISDLQARGQSVQLICQLQLHITRTDRPHLLWHRQFLLAGICKRLVHLLHIDRRLFCLLFLLLFSLLRVSERPRLNSLLLSLPSLLLLLLLSLDLLLG